MENFTPLSATLGGLLIGAGAVLLLAANGRIAGISGIMGDLLPPRPAADWTWRLAYVVGLVAGILVYALADGAPPTITFSASLPTIIAGGLLVGAGTILANGCTSGHGVCGLARLSPRSLAATATFMAVAVATVWVVRHGLGG